MQRNDDKSIPETLLFPRVAVAVIAVLFPETEDFSGKKLYACHPFG
jgi:hypothetical protein